MRNKKGLSAVIVSMMLVLLAIVSVGVVFVVVNNSVGDTQNEVESRQRCLGVNVVPVAADCSFTKYPNGNATVLANKGCRVSYRRLSGGVKTKVEGVRVSLLDNVSVNSVQFIDEHQLEQLERRTSFTVMTSDVSGDDAAFLEVVPYVLVDENGNDEEGNRAYCPATSISKIAIGS